MRLARTVTRVKTRLILVVTHFERRFRALMPDRLPAVIRNPDAFKKLEKGGTLVEAMKVVEQSEPEQGSNFFKLMAKFRDACKNAAQVKEILRIRTGTVATRLSSRRL